MKTLTVLLAFCLSVLAVTSAVGADGSRLYVYASTQDGFAVFVDVNSLRDVRGRREYTIISAADRPTSDREMAYFVGTLSTNCQTLETYALVGQGYDRNGDPTSEQREGRVGADEDRLSDPDTPTRNLACGTKGDTHDRRTFSTEIEAANWFWRQEV